MIPFQGQKLEQNRQPPDINFLPISGFEPRISHILGVTSPTMTLSPCRRAMYVSIYPPLHIAEPRVTLTPPCSSLPLWSYPVAEYSARL